MGQKFIPRVIIWDEVCTVPWPILETFCDWLEAAERAIRTDDWRLGYSMTDHSSQGVPIQNTHKNVSIIDDYLQWSNLAYLAVSRVEYMEQLERVVCPPEEDSEEKKNNNRKKASRPQAPRRSQRAPGV